MTVEKSKTDDKISQRKILKLMMIIDNKWILQEFVLSSFIGKLTLIYCTSTGECDNRRHFIV